MASIKLDLSKPVSVDLYGLIGQLQTAAQAVDKHRQAMIQALNGADQDTAASYAPITGAYGIDIDANSMAGFKELDAAMASLPAINQLAAKFKLPK
jgi:hypothetical protein